MLQNTPKVLFSPGARSALKDGFDQVARLLAQTLGPFQGITFHSTAQKPNPEPLTDAATIARRIVALPNRAQNVGGMLLRNLVWRVHQRVGDGGATTAVLAQAILEQATRYVMAGANPVRIQVGIQKAAEHAVTALRQMAIPVTSQEELALVAYATTHEPELSFVLGEMFDLLGEHAHVVIEEYMAPYLEREYITGGRWQARLISPYLVSAPGSGKAVARDCNVVLVNGNLTTAEEVLPLLCLLGEKEKKNLLLVALKISGEALNTLVATYSRNKGTLEFVLVDLARAGEKALNDMQDLALLTGAKLFDPGAGSRLTSIMSADFGMAQRAEANAEYLFVTGGRGDPAALREQISTLHKYLGRLAFDDSQAVEI
jgi:chaperonin GroEL